MPVTVLEVIMAKGADLPEDLRQVSASWCLVPSRSFCFDIHRAILLDELGQERQEKLLSLLGKGQIYFYEDLIRQVNIVHTEEAIYS